MPRVAAKANLGLASKRLLASLDDRGCSKETGGGDFAAQCIPERPVRPAMWRTLAAIADYEAECHADSSVCSVRARAGFGGPKRKPRANLKELSGK